MSTPEIDTEVEAIFPVNDAWDAFPGIPRVSRPTIYRWIFKGVNRNGRNVKLGTVVIGSKRFTSRQAIIRFVQAQN